MSSFPPHTVDSAPLASRPALTAAARHLGHLPDALARLATSPAAVAAFNAGLQHFERGTLTPLEREVLVFTVATRNGCHYCVAFHSQQLEQRGTAPAVIASLRACTPLEDPRLESVRQFTLALLDGRGAVSEAELQRFFEAGHTAEQALDLVVGVGTYTLSTFANRLTGARLDPPLAKHAWSGCGARPSSHDE